jgi:uncharacterized membrane protein
MATAPSYRLAYIDWLRGFACLLMFQTHCYDAWLGGSARNSTFFMWSQIGGTFPAPLFLFLAGVSFAIVTDKLLQKGLRAGHIAKTTIRRGAEILGFGLLFRLQEYVVSLGWAPWSDLFRVDILNAIGVSMILMGVICWGAMVLAGKTGTRSKLTGAAIMVAAAISAVTPMLWTTWSPHFLHWELETYINGVHNLGTPQPGFFPIFPWTGFAFAGLAFGFLLMSEPARKLGAAAILAAGGVGIILIYVAKFLDSRELQIYPVFDFWHTSPEFFMMRIGFLLLFVVLAYAWCRWGLGEQGFSPMIQLGNTSLLVYWVHIELVYGRFTILPRKSESVAGASAGLLIIFLTMLALSILRTKWKGRPRDLLSWRPGLSRSA